MPAFELTLAIAEFENVLTIEPEPDIRWGLTVVCDECKTVTENFIFVDEAESSEMPGGGTCNSFFKCKGCAKLVSINVDGRARGAFCTAGGSGADKAQAVMGFEFRGGAPAALHARDASWVVVCGVAADADADGGGAAKEGTTFEGVKLHEDWCDYDEKAACAVSVLGAAFEFRRRR